MVDSNEEEQPVILERCSRSTRGKRMTKLVDEEIEDDELFWNQDALKEEEEDNNYKQEPEAADVFDSDFDVDEPELDGDAENAIEERLPLKKKSTNIQEVNNETENEKIIRKSTRTAVVVRQAEREAIREAIQATMKLIKRKKGTEDKRMSQEEMLLEASQTEIINMKNLERMLAREEEVKERAIVHKNVYTGQQIHYSSKNGISTLEFRQGATFQSEINTKSMPYPEKNVCTVTGLPAKYRDPKIGLPLQQKKHLK